MESVSGRQKKPVRKLLRFTAHVSVSAAGKPFRTSRSSDAGHQRAKLGKRRHILRPTDALGYAMLFLPV